MKNSLKLLSLLLAASVPSTIAAEFAGLMVPAPIDTLHVFAAYVIVVAVLTLVSDYTKPVRLSVLHASTAATPALNPLLPANKATHALAA